MPLRAAFLDRDGTINEDLGYVHRREEWSFLPRAIEALHKLQAAGFTLIIVSNQSGIARGHFREEDVRSLHAWVQKELSVRDVAIDAVLFCPHAPDDGCECRKPRVGMAHEAESLLGQEIDYPASWMLGDKLSDVEFGFNLGMRTALIRSPYWQPDDIVRTPDLIGEGLHDLVTRITAAP